LYLCNELSYKTDKLEKPLSTDKGLVLRKLVELLGRSKEKLNELIKAKAPIYGASRWIKNNTIPLITDKQKDYNAFWFTKRKI